MLRAALLLLLSAQQPVPSEVPLAKEPSHYLEINNDFVRVFRVEIPKVSQTLVHRHELDHIVLSRSDADIEDTQPGGYRSLWKLKRDDIHFVPAAGEQTFIHRIINRRGDPYRDLTIELKRGEFCSRWQQQISATNDFIRAQRQFAKEFADGAGRFAENGWVFRDIYSRVTSGFEQKTLGPALLVAVNGTQLLINDSDAPLKAGEFRWFDRSVSIKRKGTGWYHFFLVQFSPSSCYVPPTQKVAKSK